MVEFYSKSYSSDAMSASVDSRSILDLLRESRANWMELVEKHSKFLSEEMKECLIKEIVRLSELDDWTDDDIPVTKEAAQAFMKLLVNLEPEIFPGVACDYQGRVVLQWNRGNDVAWFNCYSRNWVRWVVLIQDGDKEVTFSGKNSVSKVLSELKKIRNFRKKFLAN